MTGPTLRWIDWRLAGRSVARDSLVRLPFLVLAAFAFLALLLSGGANRFLASRYAVTAILQASVPAGEGEGLARKIAELPAVRSAVYKDPEASWQEFLQAYPGLESMRAAGGNPLPGYIEIRLRPERLTAADVDAVTSVLRPVPYVDKVLAGEGRLPRLLRARRWAAWLVWGAFGVFVALFSAGVLLQERVRAVALSADIAFLEARGALAGRIAISRAAEAALSAFLLALAGVALSGTALRHLLARYPSLETVVGPPAELLSPRTAVAVAGFLLFAASLAAISSLLGYRAARAGRR